MKASYQNKSAGLLVNTAMCAALRRGGSRFFAVALTAGLALSQSGCLSLTIHKHAVDKTVVAKNRREATLDELNNRLADQYSQLKTLNAKVTIKASTGGQHEGEVKEIPAFSGFILLRKPSDLRVIMELPVVGSMALDMVADGKIFKLSIPPKKIAREGSEVLTTPSSKGFENLRPSVVRDALQVPPVGSDEFVSETQNARILPPVKGRKEATEEPDYDLTVSRVKQGRELQTVRVIHVSRVTLKPYEQDIYDKAGHLVEIVTYDKYQTFGGIDFPMSILIAMPIDEYSMQIDITKLTLNQDMDDEQFVLKFPEGTPVQKMP
jgi:outer membrane lipoprotein-sorting protein